MDLKLKDVAEFLNVSTTTIRRWLVDGKIPAYKINNQYRFNRAEIEDWVMRHRLEGESEALEELVPKTTTVRSGSRQFSLYRAIHKGDVLDNIPGTQKEQVIRATAKQVALSLDLDADVLTEMLLHRERLMPTALNHGIGVPHTRDFLLNGHQDVVVVVYPEQPIAYGALDGQPVHTLFFLFACEDRRHLNLLAKIAHLSSQPESLAFFQTRPPKAELLSYIKEWEGRIQSAEESS